MLLSLFTSLLLAKRQSASANSMNQTAQKASFDCEGRKPLSLHETLKGKNNNIYARRMLILKEDIDLANLQVRNLTNDCKFVRRTTGEIDLVREYSSVRIFDYYWDRGIKILQIWHSGGTRNPKFQQPEF